MRPKTVGGSCSRLRVVTGSIKSSLSSGLRPTLVRVGFSTSVARTMRASGGRLAAGSFDALRVPRLCDGQTDPPASLPRQCN